MKPRTPILQGYGVFDCPRLCSAQDCHHTRQQHGAKESKGEKRWQASGAPHQLQCSPLLTVMVGSSSSPSSASSASCPSSSFSSIFLNLPSLPLTFPYIPYFDASAGLWSSWICPSPTRCNWGQMGSTSSSTRRTAAQCSRGFVLMFRTNPPTIVNKLIDVK